MKSYNENKDIVVSELKKELLNLKKELEDLYLEHSQLKALINENQTGSSLPHIKDIYTNNDEIYKQIVDSANEGIWILDINGRTTFANKRMAEMLGYSQKDFFGKTIYDFMDEETINIAKENFRQRQQGKIEQYEQKYIRKDGSFLWAMLSTSPIFDNKGNMIGKLDMVSDVTEHKYQEETLLQSEERYRQLVESANSIIIRYDTKGTLKFINEYTLSFFGYTREEMIGKSVKMIVPERESTGKDLSVIFEDILNHPQNYPQFENENLKKNGEHVWVTWTNRAIMDEHGFPVEILSIGTDITRLKQIEEEAHRRSKMLSRERELFRGIVDNIPVMITIYDPELQNFRFNKALKELTGWTEDDATDGKFVEKVYPDPDYRSQVIDFMKSLQPGWKEWTMTTKDGFQVESSWANIYLTSGVQIGIGIDVGERKQAEQKLYEQAHFIASITETIPDMISVIELPSRKFLYANQEPFRIQGFDPEDIMIMSPEERPRLVHPDDQVSLANYFRNLENKKDSSVAELEYRAKTMQGEWKWFKARGRVFERNSKGKVKSCINILQNITHQKEAELKLKKSEQRLRGIFDNAAIGIVEIDKNNRFIAVNDRLCEILDYRSEELICKSVSEITAPEDLERSDELNAKIHRKDATKLSYEKKYLKRDGSPVWVHVTVSGIYDAKGNLINSIGTVEDISERKKAEQALRESEEKFRMLADNISQFVWIVNTQGKFLWFNKRWLEYTGLTLEEMQSGAGASLIHPDNSEQVMRNFQLAIENGTPWEDVYLMRRKDGEFRWFLNRALPIYGEDGKITLWFGTNTDIHEQKIAEAALKESEEMFSTMFQVLPIGVSLSNFLDRTLYNVNPAWLNITGYSKEEVLGKNPDILGLSMDVEQRNRVRDEFRQHNKVRNLEITLLTKTGSQRTITTNLDPIHLSGQKFLLATMEDITERKRIEKELKQKNEELTRFIYTVSHDLKSPLVTIKSFTSFLIKDIEEQNKDSQEKDIKYIQNAADRMGILLNELLELSRIGRKEIPKQEIELKDIAQSAIDLVAGRLSQKNIKVNFTGPPVMLFGHSQRLIQLYQNLLDNAAKFMGNQPDPFIEIGSLIDPARNNEMVLFVRDNGSGIDPRYHHKIFGLFEKLDNSTEGTGIGLALIKRIVEVHGGSIWIHSEGVDKGTTFYFTLERTRLK